MGTVFTYFKWRKKDSTDDYTYFHDFDSIVINRKIKSNTNTIKITLSNKFGRYSGAYDINFGEEDEIFIYGHWGEIVEASHLLISAFVKEMSFSSTEGSRKLVLTCIDRTYQLLNKIYMEVGFKDSDNKTAPAAIKQIVDWVSEKDNRDGAIDTTTYIETTPTGMGGTAFDNISMALNMKTAYEWIEQLSNDPYTRYDTGSKSDRQYIFWIDESNKFHWKYPSQTADATINLDNINTHSVKLKKTTFDMVNMVIFNAGNDPNGNGIIWYFYDKTSKQPELRVKFQPMIEIAKDLSEREQKEMDRLSISYDASGYPDNYANYNAEADLPTWGYGESPDNDGEYLGSIGLGDADGDGFRGACVRTAKAQAASITELTGDLRWKGSFVTKGTVIYSAGDLLKVTWSDANMVNQKLRVVGVNHNINSKGWETTISVKEDTKAITD